MARQLSFSGVTFSIDEVPLAEKVIEMYDASVELVRALIKTVTLVWCKVAVLFLDDNY